MTAFFMSGRRVANYAEHGEAIPADFVRVPCLICAAPLMLSPEGADSLREAHAAKHEPCGALCTPCTIRLKVENPHTGVLVGSSKLADEQMKTNPVARALFEYLTR